MENNPILDRPLRFIEVIRKEYLDRSLQFILPDSSLLGKVMPHQSIYFYLRGLLFLHKAFGIIQNPFETTSFEDSGTEKKLKEILNLEFESDSTFYRLLIEGGNPLFELIRQKGYSFRQFKSEVQHLKVFQ
ncbi:MAG: hypothetical protein HC852_09920 [Acaryochloridaceae cyanobacterium RU_4_10]|nr:hypothetical protein [Acaryochloridaceae cyanobacterium RU_4_10]